MIRFPSVIYPFPSITNHTMETIVILSRKCIHRCSSIDEIPAFDDLDDGSDEDDDDDDNKYDYAGNIHSITKS